MKRIYLLSLMAYFISFGAATAGGGNNVQSLFKTWGGDDYITCQNHQVDGMEICIGESQRSGCAPRKMYARDYTDEYALLMMVAMEVNDKGARFCPIQVEAKNKNKGNAWTEYADATAGNGALCTWLCLPGYSGPECNETDAQVASCDATPLTRESYSNIKRIKSGPNIEDSVAMFYFNRWKSCGMHKSQEHDVILAITRWLPSGHGAFVHPVVVRAAREGWKNMVSFPYIYTASGAKDVLVCKNGYKQNANRTDCEPIDVATCQLQQLCNGWGNGYDENLHVLFQNAGETCFKYRCRTAGEAFVSQSDHSCAECVVDARSGVNPADGTCVRCNPGLVFNENVASGGYCGTADMFSKTDMQYGTGQTKNSIALKFQCWLKRDAENYRECVISGAKSGHSDLEQ